VSSIINLFRLRPRKQDRFEELLRPHIELLYRMAFRWTQSQHRAEDLVQDVLVRLVSQVEAMEQVENLRPWLVRIVYHRYVDLYRRQRNSPIDESHSGWAPDEEDDGQAANDPIAQAVDSRDDFAQLELQQSLSRAQYSGENRHPDLDGKERHMVTSTTL
jgi:RNA polymerase sigma-70 factor, ECF subfamily